MSKECELQMNSEYSPRIRQKGKVIIVNVLNFTYNIRDLGKDIGLDVKGIHCCFLMGEGR